MVGTLVAHIVLLTVQPNMTQEFEKNFSALTTEVRATEPGTLLYQLVRSRTQPNSYRLIEIFASQEAREAHGHSDAVKKYGPKLMSLYAEPMKLEAFDPVVPFQARSSSGAE